MRGRSLPRNVEAPPALPISSAEPAAAVPSWINSGATASPLLKRAQLNGATMAAKEEVN